ncbi:MAG: dUTP diphosphatase [Liquorilactobacillus hordei]|uniref:dUTP diphosphatase n=2 Tax=Liquorilactobacillus hordei TaxID=468911 RepID=A0A0R1MKQ5_9LACO|nr:dUTP diphosphatase [Liquorilactobacillus hordei]AUJ29212.1 dUTP diphosphatase [Liquorilactobacillus hordei]KRL06532.1 Deoxyuridine 5-triphosphate nucleotidohydrolase [Liquorilactobacillus hordei DSM 19519]MBZ2405545.1 dUTP diphosphatase [Liquorilactobacillus hordei]QYH51925.1 dUTP diphosphatase [Liquorilactobacillus hordei DSM 19519]
MKRGFKVVKRFNKEEIKLPTRATKNAAGYDFYAAQEFVLPSIWKLNFLKILWSIRKNQEITDIDYEKASKVLKPFLVPTGIKAYMGTEEFLMLANRSSNPLKRNLILPNGVGIIDADYYGNADNDGEIFLQLLNFGIKDVVIKKNERIGQGIFMPFLTIDVEEEPLKKRTGGFGSSGR